MYLYHRQINIYREILEIKKIVMYFKENIGYNTNRNIGICYVR